MSSEKDQQVEAETGQCLQDTLDLSHNQLDQSLGHNQQDQAYQTGITVSTVQGLPLQDRTGEVQGHHLVDQAKPTLKGHPLLDLAGPIIQGHPLLA